jgi:hypothetical protein
MAGIPCASIMGILAMIKIRAAISKGEHLFERTLMRTKCKRLTIALQCSNQTFVYFKNLSLVLDYINGTVFLESSSNIVTYVLHSILTNE